MSDKAIIADIKPIKVELTKGEDQYFCACGKSAKQPFCDGAHGSTGEFPITQVFEEEKKVAWCQCKCTKNPPYCDGTHAFRYK